ncbi:MAG: hypothetical protein A3D87_06395 [Omnitrophica WOR_2 bacterium RIFCSPHIGHO2_02_FULL_50_17]|nr:MAG: hypothetical protein A3D87_06395 [Omnitrophica WOR_2 bacterium RIFCSPHIGHO2_02_FULL_50_17]
MARTFIAVGVVLIIVGIGIQFLGKIPGLGKLPGDILIKKENFTFYFPLATCLLVSIVLSLIFFLWHQR